jgi:hypothetical protein
MNTHGDKMLHDAASRLLSGLRQGRGIDAQAAVDLKAQLRIFAEAWAMFDSVPKSSANLFVDLPGGIEACRYMYAGQEAERSRCLPMRSVSWSGSVSRLTEHEAMTVPTRAVFEITP